jgi:hypothetical protein
MEQQGILACRRRRLIARVPFRQIFFEFTPVRRAIPFSGKFSVFLYPVHFFCLVESLCQPHQHFGIIQSRVALPRFTGHLLDVCPTNQSGSLEVCQPSPYCCPVLKTRHQYLSLPRFYRNENGIKFLHVFDTPYG